MTLRIDPISATLTNHELELVRRGLTTLPELAAERRGNKSEWQQYLDELSAEHGEDQIWPFRLVDSFEEGAELIAAMEAAGVTTVRSPGDLGAAIKARLGG